MFKKYSLYQTDIPFSCANEPDTHVSRHVLVYKYLTLPRDQQNWKDGSSNFSVRAPKVNLEVFIKYKTTLSCAV